MRVGWGFDAHRLIGTGRTVLAGVVASEHQGVEATSDGDVVAHAVMDALLGAAALGDIGMHFPSDDPRWQGADSMDMLSSVREMVVAAGYRPESVDVTVVAEEVRAGPIRESMRRSLAAALQVDKATVSVKATTTDGLGFIGSGEGLAAVAVTVLVEG